MRRFLILTALLAMVATACSDDHAASTTVAAVTTSATTAQASSTTEVPAQSSTTSTTTTPTTSTTNTASTTSTTTATISTTTTSTTTTSTTTTSTTTTTTTTLAPVGPGDPPSASITWPPNLSSHTAAFDSGLVDFVAPVTLMADVDDPDGDIAKIEWFSSDEGLLGTGDSIDVSLSTMGTDVAQPFITVRVTDAAGNVTEQQIQLIVWIPSDE